MHFFDEETCARFKKEFGEKDDFENYYIAQCNCPDCDHYFTAKILIDITVLEIRY